MLSLFAPSFCSALTTQRLLLFLLFLLQGTQGSPSPTTVDGRGEDKKEDGCKRKEPVASFFCVFQFTRVVSPETAGARARQLVSLHFSACIKQIVLFVWNRNENLYIENQNIDNSHLYFLSLFLSRQFFLEGTINKCSSFLSKQLDNYLHDCFDFGAPLFY